MARYILSGVWKSKDGDKVPASKERWEYEFEAADDKAAAAHVAGYRKDRAPLLEARLVRIGEIAIEIADTPGYESLPWEYCECGCKSHIISLGSQHFSLFNDLKGNFYLSRGHTPLVNLGTFSSFADADREVRRIAKPHFQKEMEAMRKQGEELSGVILA